MSRTAIAIVYAHFALDRLCSPATYNFPADNPHRFKSLRLGTIL